MESVAALLALVFTEIAFAPGATHVLESASALLNFVALACLAVAVLLR